MPKFVNSPTYNTVDSTSASFIDLGEFEAFQCETNSNGCLSVIPTESGKRIRFGKSLLETIGNPDAVKMLFKGEKLAICTVPLNTPGSYQVKKGGVVYSTQLADQIISLNTNLKFAENSSTRCGEILQVQKMPDESLAAIITFE